MYIYLYKSMEKSEQKQSHWNKEIRASFKRVIAWDVLFFVLGIGVGLGIGAFLTTI